MTRIPTTLNFATSTSPILCHDTSKSDFPWNAVFRRPRAGGGGSQSAIIAAESREIVELEEQLAKMNGIKDRVVGKWKNRRVLGTRNQPTTLLWCCQLGYNARLVR